MLPKVEGNTCSNIRRPNIEIISSGNTFGSLEVSARQGVRASALHALFDFKDLNLN